MTYWRWVFLLGDYYLLQYGWVGGVVGIVSCYGLLVLLGATRTCIFTPFYVLLDTREDVLSITTRLGTKVRYLTYMPRDKGKIYDIHALKQK